MDMRAPQHIRARIEADAAARAAKSDARIEAARRPGETFDQAQSRINREWRDAGERALRVKRLRLARRAGR